jgi:hypothetical protein
LGALAHAIDEADKFLFSLRRGTDDDQQALRIFLPGAAAPRPSRIPVTAVAASPVGAKMAATAAAPEFASEATISNPDTAPSPFEGARNGRTQAWGRDNANPPTVA